MSSPSLTAEAEGREAGVHARAAAAELRTDAQMLGAGGAVAAAMIAVAQAELAAAITVGVTTAAAVPLWLRARRLERATGADARERSRVG